MLATFFVILYFNVKVVTQQWFSGTTPDSHHKDRVQTSLNAT